MMIKIDDAVIDKIRLAEQGADPATPVSGYGYFYYKDDVLYLKDFSGIVTGLGEDVSARVYNSIDLTSNTGSGLTITFDSEAYDTHDMHSVSSETHKLVCKVAGKYMVNGQVRLEAVAGGQRYIFIYKNSDVIAQQGAVGTVNAEEAFTIATIIDLAVDDIVSLQFWQDSGSDVDVKAYDYYSPYFMAQKIG